MKGCHYETFHLAKECKGESNIQRSAVGFVCLVKQRSVSLSEDVQSRILQTTRFEANPKDRKPQFCVASDLKLKKEYCGFVTN